MTPTPHDDNPWTRRTFWAVGVVLAALALTTLLALALLLRSPSRVVAPAVGESIEDVKARFGSPAEHDLATDEAHERCVWWVDAGRAFVRYEVVVTDGVVASVGVSAR